ncbi:MAG: hypothetical protein PF694_13490 [Bacteroidetes bacterium]|jgi:hypothetical protein|nr:hypothetical protein [Bacteroidota bacterium]
MTQKKFSKFIKLLMAFAIFWMVIGDLITYHQQVIFGVNFFDTHNPFTKPKSKEDGSTLVFKPHKPADKQDRGLDFIQDGIIQQAANKHLLVSQRLLPLHLITQYKALRLNLSCSLRAPPFQG